jgi:lipoteichoic acid synthase
LGFLRRLLLDRWERVYSLSLLVPFVFDNLVLKAISVFSSPGEDHGLVRTFKLMRSDALFNLAYALLWSGLFAAVKRVHLRWVLIFLFHTVTILMAIVRACAHQYFRQTGTTLDFDIVALWGPRFEEVKPMIKIVPPFVRVLIAASFLYATLGPLLATRVIGRDQKGPGNLPAGMCGVSFSSPMGLLLLALGFGSLSLLAGSGPTGASRSFARDPIVNLIITGIRNARTEDSDLHLGTDDRVQHPAASARLVPTPRTEERKVVLIHLESTRAQSVTPYHEDIKTTPFLDDLAKNSLLAERAYTTVPNTLKASVSVNCGIEPHLVQRATEARPGGILVPCLANLLKEQGYRTVLFQSSTQNFESFGDLAKNLGYEEYYPIESMDTEGFERSNYFGYEDDVMLKPSKQWLKEHKDEPFLAKYLTGTGHHDYQPPTRYGLKNFSEDDRLNRYLNCIRYQDIFLRNLFDQYKELGLYHKTIFIIYGDHGEGFGEHGRYVHEDNPYEESLRVPLIVHAPGWFEDGKRVEGPANLTDILPTILEMLGYEVKDGQYPGYSLLHSLPKGRTLMFSCFNKNKCLVSIRGLEKYIHHYGNQPDELFDLSRDPFEKHNLANERGREAEKRRDELFAWRSRINAMYGG